MNDFELDRIVKRYGQRTTLDKISLATTEKEFIVVVGPSGCGKSTLLKIIAGLEPADAGRVLIDGRDVTRLEPGDRDIAMVFQSYALYPHMTVAENMGFGLRMAGRPKAEIREAVENAASILQISDYLDMRPKQLSGGQRQRVAIGRAITRSPSVFLFDEPLSNLDAALRTRMRIEIGMLYRRLDATMIYVTHDQVEAMTMATRIVLMNQGGIEQIGVPSELYVNPVNRFVAGFLGSPRMNFMTARVADVDDESFGVSLEGLEGVRVARRPEARLVTGDEITLGLRPEDIRTDGGGEHRLAGQVSLVEEPGRESIAYIDAGAVRASESEDGLGHLTVQADRRTPMRRDDSVTLGFDSDALYVFDAAGNTMTPRRPLDTPSAPNKAES
ncbi:ABC transporter ATP-binding protein [Kushneria aurantia]|uniref:ABC transporter ATP-binding protein n=1 Tax=Kushneria aurantia TaxID=504092 RepID=A0ABV6G5P0_9GAMM|nr:ABC transporter ATP-binding protein [Kushneria aurantia]